MKCNIIMPKNMRGELDYTVYVNDEVYDSRKYKSSETFLLEVKEGDHIEIRQGLENTNGIKSQKVQIHSTYKTIAFERNIIIPISIFIFLMLSIITAIVFKISNYITQLSFLGLIIATIYAYYQISNKKMFKIKIN